LREAARRRGRFAANVSGYLLATAAMGVILALASDSRNSANAVLGSTGTHFMVCAPGVCACSRTPPDAKGAADEGFLAGGATVNLIPADLAVKIKGLPAVADASPFLMARLHSKSDGHAFTVGGFDVSNGLAVGATCCAPSDLVGGRFLTPEDVGLVMAEEAYAKARRLKLGDRLIIAGAAYHVAGIVNAGIRPAKADVYMPIEEARKAAASHLPGVDLSPYATAVLVEVKNAGRQEEAFKSVKSLFPGLVISSYACYRPAEQVMGINEDAFRALGAGIAAFILLLVMRSQIVVVMERRREIGMLKAIGWPDKNVVRLLFAETILQAAAGVAVGCLLAIVAARFIATGAALSGGALALSAGLPFLGGTAAAILSAWKAARVRPGDALRQT
jgi:putative ABC transport system permease protein